MIDDYHNVDATSHAIHMATYWWTFSKYRPPYVSIHRPVRVNVKGTELTCYSGIDDQCSKHW